MPGTPLSTPIQPVELTKEGLAELKKELEELKTVKLPSVIDRVAKAREHGDLSENAEYHDALSEQEFTQVRIDEIEIVLAKAVVIKQTHSTIHIGNGSTVVVVNNQTKKHLTVTIVGEYEGDPKVGKISGVSPLGKALMGKMKGDKVMVKAPGGETEYTIKEIK